MIGVGIVFRDPGDLDLEVLSVGGAKLDPIWTPRMCRNPQKQHQTVDPPNLRAILTPFWG